MHEVERKAQLPEKRRFKTLSSSRYSSINCVFFFTTQGRNCFLNYLFLNENYTITKQREEWPQDSPSGCSWLSDKKLQQERLPVASASHRISRCWKHSHLQSPGLALQDYSHAYKTLYFVPSLSRESVTSLFRAGCILHIGPNAPFSKTIGSCELQAPLTLLLMTPSGIMGLWPNPPPTRPASESFSREQ